MAHRWLVTIDNLSSESFDEFLKVFLLGEEHEATGIGDDYESMSPATTAILVSDETTGTLLGYVKGHLDPHIGRATVAKLSGGNQYIGKVWDINMAVDDKWKSR